jgi:hypothetical protein
MPSFIGGKIAIEATECISRPPLSFPATQFNSREYPPGVGTEPNSLGHLAVENPSEEIL